MISANYEVAVDPENLIKVRCLHPVLGTEMLLVALACAYVPVTGMNGRRQVAVEVVYDPAEQNPAVPYYADPMRLQQLLIPPGHLRGVHPYR